MRRDACSTTVTSLERLVFHKHSLNGKYSQYTTTKDLDYRTMSSHQGNKQLHGMKDLAAVSSFISSAS
jgi:hypothetical protein